MCATERAIGVEERKGSHCCNLALCLSIRFSNCHLCSFTFFITLFISLSLSLPNDNRFANTDSISEPDNAPRWLLRSKVERCDPW